MNYQETLDFLFSQLPMYQRQGKSAFKKDLTNIIALCNALGNPQNNVRCIHVAGTNGKGSCSHMTAAVLQASGLKVGLYTSPHLIDFRERIRINGVCINEAWVVDFVERIKPILSTIQPSFFEITVAMAFDYFDNQNVDVAVIETGLGGRLDSTNIIHPVACLITNIGMDHMDMLGDTLPLIAAEKAGIIKPNTPVVIGERHPETNDVFIQKATSVQAPILFAQDVIADKELLASDLIGAYQKHNIRAVMTLVSVLNEVGFNIAPRVLAQGLKEVSKRTGLRGRWEVLSSHPLTVCDTGHNKDGIKALVEQIKQQEFEVLHIVFGQVTGKSVEDTLALMPKNAQYYFCAPDVIRKLDVSELHQAAISAGLTGNTYKSVAEAYHAAQKAAKPSDMIFIGGSTFVVADLLSHLEAI